MKKEWLVGVILVFSIVTSYGQCPPVSQCVTDLSQACVTVEDMPGGTDCDKQICVHYLPDLAIFDQSDPTFSPHYRLFFTCEDGQYFWSDSIFAGELIFDGTACYQACIDVPDLMTCNNPRIEIALYRKTPPSDDDDETLRKQDLGTVDMPGFSTSCTSPPPGPPNDGDSTFCDVRFTRQPRETFYTNLLIDFNVTRCMIDVGYTVKVVMNEAFTIYHIPPKCVLGDDLPPGVPLIEPPTCDYTCYTSTCMNSAGDPAYCMEITNPYDIEGLQHLVLNLYTPDQLPIQSTQVEVHILPNPGCTSASCTTDEVEILSKRDPYDPNNKWMIMNGLADTTDYWEITKAPLQDIHYRIEFSNDSADETAQVIVTDVLDKRLDESTMQMRFVRLGDQVVQDASGNMMEDIPLLSDPSGGKNRQFTYHYHYDPDTRKITWTFQGGHLFGKKHRDFGTNFQEEHTQGSIEFLISTKCFQENNVQIENKAGIEFFGRVNDASGKYLRSADVLYSSPATIKKWCCPLTHRDSVVKGTNLNGPVTLQTTITTFKLDDFRKQGLLPSPNSAWRIRLVEHTFRTTMDTDFEKKWDNGGEVAYFLKNQDHDGFISGVDTLRFEVCAVGADEAPLVCETIEVLICVNLLRDYPCEKSDCPACKKRTIWVCWRYWLIEDPIIAYPISLLLGFGFLFGAYSLFRRRRSISSKTE